MGPDAWGGWAHGVDCALEALFCEIQRIIENIPQTEINLQPVRESLLEFGNENFNTFKQNSLLESDGTQKLNSQNTINFEQNVHAAMQKLRVEIYAKFAVLEAQETSLAVTFGNQLEKTKSLIEEVCFRHVTNSLARAEKIFSDAFSAQKNDFA